jgi:hypothetical protein
MLSLRTSGAAEQPHDYFEEHSAPLRPLYHPQRIEATRSVTVHVNKASILKIWRSLHFALPIHSNEIQSFHNCYLSSNDICQVFNFLYSSSYTFRALFKKFLIDHIDEHC